MKCQCCGKTFPVGVWYCTTCLTIISDDSAREGPHPSLAMEIVYAVTGGLETTKDRVIVGITTGYFVMILVLVAMAFDFEGRIDFDWTMALLAVTLPWSLIAIPLAWPLIHGAGLPFFGVYFTVTGLLNGYLLSRAVGSRFK